MRTLPWARVWTALLGSLLICASTATAQGPHSVAEQYLFAQANAERQARGLGPLQWDETLHQAALLHAQEMARRMSISHQYAGEPELAARAQDAGARFSVVAENVAEAPNAVLIHRGWMLSEHHRDNLLDPRLDRVAIGVLMRGGELFAVEDFDHSVATLSFGEQEQAVAGLMASAAPLQIEVESPQARSTCTLETGYAGIRRPWFVMRFTAGELNQLPGELVRRLATGRYHAAEIGACAPRDTGRFTGYNVAVLLFP